LDIQKLIIKGAVLRPTFSEGCQKGTLNAKGP
jgi:hypothetical protein